jgi:O-antigen ligase
MPVMETKGIAKVARYIVLACLFVIPFIVLFVGYSMYFPFITGKGFAFRILVEIALAAYVVLAVADRKYRPKFSWPLALYGALVVWMVVADALAVSPLKAFWSNFERMDGWVTLVHLFAFFVIAGTVLSVDSLWKKWWMTFLASSALVSLYGVGQLLGWFQIHQGGVRLDATIGNAEYLAGYLLFAIAIALWQAMESKGWLRYTLYALAALHTLILFFTATRGAIIAAAGAVALGAILWMVEAGGKGRKTAAIAFVAVVVLAGGFYLMRDSSFVQHEPTLRRLASISLSDGQARFMIWNMALQGFEARPVTGWGQEGFNYIFNTYYDPKMYNQEPWFDRAHNIFLDWLTQGGAPALLLFLALLITSVIALYRSGVSRAERVMLVSALAAYSFQGLFVFDNLFTYIPLAALFAVAHGANARPVRAFEKAPAPSDASVGTVVAPVAGVVLVVVFWFVNVPNIAAASDIIQGLTSQQGGIEQNLSFFKQAYAEHSFADQEITEQLTSFAISVAGQPSVPAQTKTDVLTYAVQQVNAAVAERPLDARMNLQRSLVYRAAGDLPDSLKSTQAALVLSPKKQQLILEEAVTYWQMGDVKKANADFQKAYELFPSDDQLTENAALGHIIGGDIPAAKALLTAHFGTTTVDNDLLVSAYYEAKDYQDMLPILELHARTTGAADDAFRLASAYALVGRKADARATILAAKAAHPESAATADALLKQLGQ